MNKVEKLYRYEISTISEFDDKHIYLDSFDVITETDKGYWIKYYRGKDKKKWVAKEGRKLFAYSTKVLALNNFIKRMEKYEKILSSRLYDAQHALKDARKLMENPTGIVNNNNTELPQYLIRPHDYQVFILDPTEKKYYISFNGHISMYYPYEVLVDVHGFYPAEESELEIYKQKGDEYRDFTSWQCRSDGHGGSKGGTYEEYLKYKEKYETNKLL